MVHAYPKDTPANVDAVRAWLADRPDVKELAIPDGERFTEFESSLGITLRWAAAGSRSTPIGEDSVAVMYDPTESVAYWLPRLAPTQEWLDEERRQQEAMVAYWKANPKSRGTSKSSSE